MDKVRFCPWLLPPSVCELIAVDAPVLGSTHESCSEWLVRYVTPGYRGSLFFKGPLVASDERYTVNLTQADTTSPSAYKNSIKRSLLQLQSHGETNEWEMGNFPLYSITGLRRSSRIQNDHWFWQILSQYLNLKIDQDAYNYHIDFLIYAMLLYYAMYVMHDARETKKYCDVETLWCLKICDGEKIFDKI